ncbi:hypothetical protein H9L39_00383 [Fusarium oxysporum f. sp. albedinis]|nr:hypothetical protein H9L39_00383 [Fusarium oxysporum f. sp. albedinis]
MAYTPPESKPAPVFTLFLVAVLKTGTNSVRSISKYRLITLDASSLANNLVTPYSQTDRRSVNSSKDNSPS